MLLLIDFKLRGVVFWFLSPLFDAKKGQVLTLPAIRLAILGVSMFLLLDSGRKTRAVNMLSVSIYLNFHSHKSSVTLRKVSSLFHWPNNNEVAEVYL